MKTNVKAAIALVTSLLSLQASAMSLDWTGGYRFEWTEVDKPSLSNPGQRKAYGLNYLYLSPKIIAADGVNIISRFDVLNADSTNAYANTQLGQVWGGNNNVGTPNTVPNATGTSAAYSNNQGSTNLKVSQLYLNVNQEYGALVLGRAPYHFGMGMTYNAGTGPFDHFYQTRDTVAYKVIVGDWSLMPMINKIYSESLKQGNSIGELAIQLQYENKDARSLLGVIQNTRKGSNAVNDGPTTTLGADPTRPIGDFNYQRTNFVLGRDWDSFGFRLEAGFQSGETGMQNTAGEGVNINAYGVAADLYVPKGESKWDYRLRLGTASGDNPDTATYEAFQFDRNYDVAFLLFNHRLGQRDFLNTNLIKNQTLGLSNSADDEAIGNTMYAAPSINYAWSDRLDIRNTLVYAQILTTQKNSVDAKKDLGIEYDIEFTYRPVDKIQWVNQVGLLFPGAAFENGSGAGGSLDNGFTYGFASKAAISF